MKLFLFIFFLLLSNICIAQRSTTEIIALMQEEKNALVQDLEGLFSTKEQAALSQKLENYQTRTSIVIKVLTLPTINEEDVNSQRFAYSWDVVEKEQQNGILILLSKAKTETRLELGEDILKWISSEYANRAVLNAFRPLAKKNEYYAGVDALTTELIGGFDKAYNARYWDWMAKHTNELALLFLIVMYLLVSFSIANGSRRDKLKVVFSFAKFLLFLGLVVAPLSLGRNYIENNIPEADQAYWLNMILLFYVLSIPLILFIMVLRNNRWQLINKRERLKKKELEIEGWQVEIKKDIQLLEQKYNQYIGRNCGKEWAKKEFLKLEEYRGYEKIKRFSEDLSSRVADLDNLKKIHAFFKKNEAKAFLEFYPKKLAKAYLKNLRYKLLVINPEDTRSYRTTLDDILAPSKLQLMPFFKHLVSVEDIEVGEIKSWLQRWKKMKALKKYTIYPIPLEDGKEATSAKMILNKTYKDIEEVKTPEEVYEILLKLIDHWQLISFYKSKNLKHKIMELYNKINTDK